MSITESFTPQESMYKPSLTNLHLRRLGGKLAESNEYDHQIPESLRKFRHKHSQIESDDDIVAVSVFADCINKMAVGPHDPEELAEELLFPAQWIDLCEHVLKWYLPSNKLRLFQTIDIPSGSKYYRLNTSEQKPGLQVADPSDNPPTVPDREVTFTDVEIKKLIAGFSNDPITGVPVPLPEVGESLARTVNENIEAELPERNLDMASESVFDVYENVYHNGHDPDTALIGANSHIPDEEIICLSNETEVVETRFVGNSEVIVADSDVFGYELLADDWDTQEYMGRRHEYQVRMLSYRAFVGNADDAISRALLKPK